MRVVNRLKNGDKVARKRLEKFKKLTNLQQKIFWFNIFFNNGDSRFLSLKKKKSSESDFAGITLGIKYLYDKNYYIDRCLKLEKPKVDQAIAYVLKYLDNYEDQLKYFEILAKRKDEITQTILFNEIPLLAKRRDKNIVIQDDINASLQEIFPERIYDFYMIAEKYAMPETVEHLASFVHLLPANKVKQQYRKLSNIQNYALQERLIYKLNFLTEDIKNYAMKKLAYKIKDEELQNRLIRAAQKNTEEIKNIIKEKRSFK